MADTYGLMKTRGEWTNAIENGETTLTHAEWYEKKMAEENAKKQAQQQPKPTLASISLSK